MNTTEITLDAVVLMETIDEYVGRTVHFTSHGMEFRGELVTVLDRGNGVPTDRRLTVILRGNTEAMTGFRTRIAVERVGWVEAVDFMNELSTAPEGSAEERRMTQEFIEAMNAAPAPGVTAVLADVANLRYGLKAGRVDWTPELDRIEAALRAAR